MPSIRRNGSAGEVARGSGFRHRGPMTNPDTISAVAAALARTPEWIRLDISSKDARTRLRAEETLAALISAVLTDDIAKA